MCQRIRVNYRRFPRIPSSIFPSIPLFHLKPNFPLPDVAGAGDGGVPGDGPGRGRVPLVLRVGPVQEGLAPPVRVQPAHVALQHERRAGQRGCSAAAAARHRRRGGPASRIDVEAEIG